jgi:hypothetical protein
MKRWLPVFGALVAGAIAAAIAWPIASPDMSKLGDWHNGAARFFGLITVLGVGAGFFVTRRIVAGPQVSRDGFTLSYGRVDPKPDGYREMTTITVGNLTAALAARGYEPRTAACNAEGTIAGSIENNTPLAGANFAIRDAGVRGWIRIQLAPTVEGRERSLGLVERSGPSAASPQRSSPCSRCASSA